MTEYRRPSLFDPALHLRDDFLCSEPAYGEWLKRYAGQSRRNDTAALWVIADAGHNVVAYASLSMTGIDLTKAPARLAKRSPQPIPGLLIGRLAVDQRHEGLSLGTELVKHILATALELNRSAALRAVVVSALNDAARSWWRDRLGFVPFDPDDPENFDLYLLTKDLEATLGML